MEKKPRQFLARRTQTARFIFQTDPQVCSLHDRNQPRKNFGGPRQIIFRGGMRAAQKIEDPHDGGLEFERDVDTTTEKLNVVVYVRAGIEIALEDRGRATWDGESGAAGTPTDLEALVPREILESLSVQTAQFDAVEVKFPRERQDGVEVL